MIAPWRFTSDRDRVADERERRRIERLSAIGGLVASFAHEVRNPLAALQGLAEALLSELPDGDSRREYPERMLVLHERIERFVRATLDFGRPPACRRECLSPVELLHAALDLEREAPGRWGDPQLEIAPSLPEIEVDRLQLATSLAALIDNALAASGGPEGVVVRVQLLDGEPLGGARRRLVRYDVVDRGPGIPADRLDRVFDPYFTTKPGAQGLGLTIAQALVRENGGRLHAHSLPGAGCVFSILLPEATP